MKKVCISKGWKLNAPGTNGWKDVDLPNDYSVTLPRSAQAVGGAANGFFESGIGTYVKELPFAAEPRHYILDIDGAYMCTTVRIGTYQLVTHPHGYTPFLVDLTKRVKFGEVNKLMITTKAFQPSTRWYAGAGIYRDVHLWEGGEIRIEPWDVFITTPDLHTVREDVTVSADRDAEVVIRAEITDAEGKSVLTSEMPLSVRAGEKTAAQLTMTVENATPWDMEAGYLYTMRTEILENGSVLDTDVSRFGIRTISADAENGLQLNGRTVKLRGGCIHHDHGVLGAADYPAACRRKIRKLKEAGFNALRIAHNPPSSLLMDICDEEGIIVMDEAFDCWRHNKGGDLNYHIWFDDWWARDIAAMVCRDRKHPCVIAYSIGNEIPESMGHTDGDEWSERLSAEIRRYDTTRLVTSATYQMGDGETWAERTKGYFAPLDICGYNYIYQRYEKDHEQFPERVIWGSETHALNFYHSWNSVLRNSYVIGDFTWTAYDNLGEAGTGRSVWARDGHIVGISLAGYPWRSCYQGDLDLCGYRRPQSYFREAVWLGNAEPRIFTSHPEHYGEDFSGTQWHWYDVHESWTFADEYLGRPVRCQVYTDAEEIEWILNGRVLGRSETKEAVAAMDIPYEKGELAAVAYKKGAACGRSSLHTVGKAAAVRVVSETDCLAADNRDLCYFDISVVDENGDRVTDAKNELLCLVDGGELLGIFSADPANEDQYGSNICHAFDGRAVAIVKTAKKGTVTVTVGSAGLRSGRSDVTAI